MSISLEDKIFGNPTEISRLELEEHLGETDKPLQAYSHVALSGNNSAFCYEGKESNIGKTVRKLTNLGYRKPLNLTIENPLHRITREYSALKRESTDAIPEKFDERDMLLDKAINALYATSPKQERPKGNDRVLLKRTLKFIFEEYGDSKMESTYKDRKGNVYNFKTVEHSLHAAQLLLNNKDANTSDVLAVLLHDYIEDVYLPRHHKEGMKQKEEKRLIEKGGEYILQNLLGENYEFVIENDPEHIAVQAVKRMTIRKWLDYGSNIKDLIQEKSLKGSVDQQRRHKRAQEEIITTTLIAKCADKETGVLTTEPFNVVNKIKTYGKAFQVMNKVGEYLANNETLERRSALERASLQLGISTVRSIDRDIEICQKVMHGITGEQGKLERKGLGANTQRLNDLILHNDFLDYIEPYDKTAGRKLRRDGFKEIFYSIIVLGTKLDRTYSQIDPTLAVEGETQEEMMARLTKDKEYFTGLLPDYEISEENFEKKVTEMNMLTSKKRDREKVKLQEYMNLLIALRQVVQKTTMIPEHYFVHKQAA